MIQSSYSESGTTILYVSLVLAKQLMLERVGTDVASEKSTSSSAEHPLNVPLKAFVPAYDNGIYTFFNEVQPMKHSSSPWFPAEVRLDRHTSSRDVQPERHLYIPACPTELIEGALNLTSAGSSKQHP